MSYYEEAKFQTHQKARAASIAKATRAAGLARDAEAHASIQRPVDVETAKAAFDAAGRELGISEDHNASKARWHAADRAFRDAKQSLAAYVRETPVGHDPVEHHAALRVLRSKRGST